MRRGNYYQYALIGFGLVATAFFSVFLYRELFPEYLIYQKNFIALEEFRAKLSGESPPPFKEGIKQIVIEQEDKGPPVIDRCISCHVALQIEDYSPTKIARDVNGDVIYDKTGFPELVENENYIWKKAGQDPSFAALKTARVGQFTYDVTKVLAAHPLIGRETRPFEFHPLEEYGCVSCHGGNGRGLVTDRAHGPVFDGQYEKENVGFVPNFLEKDLMNDPLFSRVFNSKPGHRLLFQTNPLYVGALIQSKCIQCHQSTKDTIESAKDSAQSALKKQKFALLEVEKGFILEKEKVKTLLRLKRQLQRNGYEKTIQVITENAEDYSLSVKEQDAAKSQLAFLKGKNQGLIEKDISNELLKALGSEKTIEEFEKSDDFEKTFESNKADKGTLFEKKAYYNYSKELLKHVTDVASGASIVSDEQAIGEIQSDVDILTKDYQKGKNLFISQGCYACHRIALFARGGVGPELTRASESYPWYLKESIVWPQADLKTSAMPNMRLDHEEVEALLTFLLAQTGSSKVISDTSKKSALLEWELGKKQTFEKAVSEREVHDINFGMTVFATEGCASCHRLTGFESNIDLDDSKWFKSLFPESILGSQIVKAIETHSKDINEKLVVDSKKNSILEEIEKSHPGALEALYSNFKFAMRAKNHEGKKAADEWKEKVQKVFKMFIQTYGLGRVICPKLNWAGAYRSDQWLMEHFKSPASHVPRSIMPAFPFDDTKFKALTYMLDTIAQKNGEKERAVYVNQGFDPEAVFHSHCSDCHGEFLQGNGPVSEWIYPVPKNLKNAEFLRNLGKERVFESIMHGIDGTPMPPWGEAVEGKTAVFTENEVKKLVDWLFVNVPGSTVIRNEEDIPKWNYTSEDVVKELNAEGADIANVFNSVENKKFGSEKTAYFIKPQFYTAENIEKGKRLFLMNCATCHGAEADGAGTRAEAMRDAKPRMLINLDWVESRDDLRLLRSIKYGVPGTSMTPWGDITSGLQRIQLVVFIRSLSEEKAEKRLIENALYDQSAAEKEILSPIGSALVQLQGSEEMIQLFIKFIKNKEDRSSLAKELESQIDEKILAKDAKAGSWIKLKHQLVRGVAELSRKKRD